MQGPAQSLNALIKSYDYIPQKLHLSKGSHLPNVFAHASSSLAFGVSIIVGWRASPQVQHFGGLPRSLLLQLNTADVSTEWEELKAKTNE